MLRAVLHIVAAVLLRAGLGHARRGRRQGVGAVAELRGQGERLGVRLLVEVETQLVPECRAQVLVEFQFVHLPIKVSNEPLPLQQTDAHHALQIEQSNKVRQHAQIESLVIAPGSPQAILPDIVAVFAVFETVHL